MIKQTAINKITGTIKTENKKIFEVARFALGAILLFVISHILGINLSISIFLISLFLYLKFRGLNIRNYRLLYVVFLFVINFSATYLIIEQRWSIPYIPFCVIPMLSAILFNTLEIPLIITLASSVTIDSVASNNFSFFSSGILGIIFLISGVLSSILVLNARRRMSIIRAGFIVGIVQAVSVFFIVGHGATKGINLLIQHISLIANGMASSIIVIGILPVFEYLFKTVTNISLLELADSHHPLLQRLIQEAPGTYHHSLIVGNLSEAACRAVGANALLARIGAYYHDIGKLSKVEYFSENQEIQESKHDNLSPTMSKLVIMNHIKEGVELAKRYKLNPLLIDFILQHHGNSLVYYFYRRALENLEDDNEIKEEGFRYPGPKPDSKETAIVLLADSVEAATRALKDPNPAKIEEIVHKIINNKFIDGQLDECNLTLKDLEKISAVFIRMLAGIYHSRIIYPEKALGSENNHKKSSKEDSHQSPKDKKDSS